MTHAFRPRTPILFLGDLLCLVFSLWVSLFVRTFEVPSMEVFLAHLYPFSFLFVVWILIFFIAGLYESRSILLARRALSSTLLIAQGVNFSIAAIFFFFIPLSIFGIAPKTLLLVYLCISFLCVLLWRSFLFPRLGLQKSENALVVGKGPEIDELVAALAAAHRAPVRVIESIDPEQSPLAAAVRSAVLRTHPRFIVADFNDPRVSGAFPELYTFLSQGIRFLDALFLYEEVFGRVPLVQINDVWLARNVSRYAHTGYDIIKRCMDIVIALVGGTLSLVFFPFIMLAIKLEDGGSAFVALPRVGEGGATISMYKFRSMTGNDAGNYGPGGSTKLRVTRVGKFLRRARLDELPQFWNMLRGDISFVGPRPETPALVVVYEKEIPYYGVRHLIKPGLSGQAQLYHHGDPHGTTDVSATQMKLSYDLFYLKHRSLTLDLSICIKTIRRILMRTNA
ncbi:MAG: sugar transferase [bacterium]